jgi:hypothetical protein
MLWTLGAAVYVSYAANSTKPVGPGFKVSAQVDKLQRLRDRPLRSWGPYLPRPLPSGSPSQATIAEAPTLGSQQPRIKIIRETQERIVEAPQAEPSVSHSPERRPTRPMESADATQSALLGAEDDPPKLAVKQSLPKAEKPKQFAKLTKASKQFVAERQPQPRRRIGLRGGGRRGLGLFALSGDFGPDKGY